MEKRFEKDERLKHIENEDERKKEEERLKVWSLFQLFQFPFSSGSLTKIMREGYKQEILGCQDWYKIFDYVAKGQINDPGLRIVLMWFMKDIRTRSGVPHKTRRLHDNIESDNLAQNPGGQINDPLLGKYFSL